MAFCNLLQSLINPISLPTWSEISDLTDYVSGPFVSLAFSNERILPYFLPLIYADAVYDCSSLYQRNYRISGVYKLPPDDFLGSPELEVRMPCMQATCLYNLLHNLPLSQSPIFKTEKTGTSHTASVKSCLIS